MSRARFPLGLLGCLALALSPASAFGGPPNADTTPAAATPLGDPDGYRQQMEKSLSELGELSDEAKESDDLARAACIFDKQERASDVMELGTSELLIIRDPTTEEGMRQFATEKLGAAARRMDALLKQARACGEDVGKSKDEVARNKSAEPSDVPWEDPLAGAGDPKVPPAVDGQWPPTASASE